MWNSLVQPHADYCAPLWQVLISNSCQEQLEAPLRTYTKKLSGMAGLSYPERLSKLGMLSIMRRGELAKITHMVNILKGQVPNPGLEHRYSSRGGLTFKIPPLTGKLARVISLREVSFLVQGPRLFNSLPRSLREFTGSKEAAKANLKDWAKDIPDIPVLQGQPNPLSPRDLSQRPSNSLQFWSKHDSTFTLSQESGQLNSQT